MKETSQLQLCEPWNKCAAILGEKSLPNQPTELTPYVHHSVCLS